MAPVVVLFIVGWGAFWIYWFASAFTMKRGRVPWSRELTVRIVIAAIVVVLVRVGAFHHHTLNRNPALAAVGLLLFASGLGFAVWARVNIGRNWGFPMSEKSDPELVTSGPYRLVRHPIYSGILLGAIGTAVGLDWVWLTAVVLAGSYFTYAAISEERFLLSTFPSTYPDYQRMTGMLFPHPHRPATNTGR